MKKKLLFVMNTMGQAGAEKALVEFLSTPALAEYEIDLYVIINRGNMYLQVPKNVNILNKHPDAGSVLNAGGRAAVMRAVAVALLKRGWIFRNLSYMLQNIKIQKSNGGIKFEKLFWQALCDSAKRFDKHYDLAVAYLEGASTYYVSKYVNADFKASFIHTDYVRAGYTPEIDKSCYDGIDRIFTVSQQASERFLSVYPNLGDKVYLFRNIINGEQIAKKSKAFTAFDDGYTGTRLLTVGRLCHEKGYDVAIDAAALLKQREIDFRWYVLGDGPVKPKLLRQIKQNGLEGQFILCGAVDNPYPYITQVDIYVHATRFEGKSVAVEEAQSLRKPIIASDCDGNAEQITDGYDGILVPLEKTKVADEIEKLINDDDKKRLLIENVSKKQLEGYDDMKNFLQLINGEGKN